MLHRRQMFSLPSFACSQMEPHASYGKNRQWISRWHDAPTRCETQHVPSDSLTRPPMTTKMFHRQCFSGPAPVILIAVHVLDKWRSPYSSKTADNWLRYLYAVASYSSDIVIKSNSHYFPTYVKWVVSSCELLCLRRWWNHWVMANLQHCVMITRWNWYREQKYFIGLRGAWKHTGKPLEHQA